jgi:hypothetical protein
MKVTVKAKQEENMNVPFDEIPVGYVYVAQWAGKPIALKLHGGAAVLLNYNTETENDFLEIAVGFKGKSAYKILGKLTEIVVEEV